jgi:hypothetical protein
MRDPERIERVCRKLYLIWGDYPDMRFGQFLENYIFGHHISHPDGCIFHIEDDIVEKKLDEMIREKQKKIFKKLQEERRKCGTM